MMYIVQGHKVNVKYVLLNKELYSLYVSIFVRSSLVCILCSEGEEGLQILFYVD